MQLVRPCVPEQEYGRAMWCGRCVEQFGSHGHQLSALRSTGSYHAGLECEDAPAALHCWLEKDHNIARLRQRLRLPRSRQGGLPGADLNCLATRLECMSRIVVRSARWDLASSNNDCSCGNGSEQRTWCSHRRGHAVAHDLFLRPNVEAEPRAATRRRESVRATG